MLPGVIVSEPALAQTELTRKVTARVSPTYPDLARRLNISGTVKMVVVVSPNGNQRQPERHQGSGRKSDPGECRTGRGQEMEI
jgi:outer membrane biosynthesis protein TonB